MRYFETVFLDEAQRFIEKQNKKTVKKILYNVDIAEQTNDPKLFKKLNGEIRGVQNQIFGIANKIAGILGQGR